METPGAALQASNITQVDTQPTDDKPDAGLASLLAGLQNSVVTLALKNLQTARMLQAQHINSPPSSQLFSSLPPTARLTLTPPSQPLPTTLPPIPMLASLPPQRDSSGLLNSQSMEGVLTTAASILGTNTATGLPAFPSPPQSAIPNFATSASQGDSAATAQAAAATIAAALPLDTSPPSHPSPPSLVPSQQPITTSGPSWTEAEPDFSRDFSTALPQDDDSQPPTNTTAHVGGLPGLDRHLPLAGSGLPADIPNVLKPMTALLWGTSTPPTITQPINSNVDSLGYATGGPGSLTYPQRRYLDGYKAVSFVRTGELKQLFGPDARTRLPVSSALRVELDGVLQPGVHSQVIFKETGANNSVYYIKGFKAALALGKMHCGFRRLDSQTCILLLRTVRADDPAMAQVFANIPRGKGQQAAGKTIKRELPGGIGVGDVGLVVKRGRRSGQKLPSPEGGAGAQEGTGDASGFAGSDGDEDEEGGATGADASHQGWQEHGVNVGALARQVQVPRGPATAASTGAGVGQCLGALADVAAAAFEAEHSNNKRVPPPAVPNPWLPSNRQQLPARLSGGAARLAGPPSGPAAPSPTPLTPISAAAAVSKPPGAPGQKPGTTMSPAFSMATQIHAGLSNWGAPLPVLLLDKSVDGTFSPGDIRCALAGVLQALRRLDVPPPVTLAVFQAFSQMQGHALTSFLTRGYTLLCHAHSTKDPALVTAALGLSMGQPVHDLLKAHIQNHTPKQPTSESAAPVDTIITAAPMQVCSPVDAGGPEHHLQHPPMHDDAHDHVEMSNPAGGSPQQVGTSESGEECVTLSDTTQPTSVSQQIESCQASEGGMQAVLPGH